MPMTHGHRGCSPMRTLEQGRAIWRPRNDRLYFQSFVLIYCNSNTHFANATTTCFLLPNPSANNQGHGGGESTVPIYFSWEGFSCARALSRFLRAQAIIRLVYISFPCEQSLVVQPPKTASSSAPSSFVSLFPLFGFTPAIVERRLVERRTYN
jgi:hypothetical protein